jgi:predicted ArsR family transcriptional regulator
MVQPAPGARWLGVDDGLVIFVSETATFIDLDEHGRAQFDELAEHGWDAEIAEAAVTNPLDAADDDAATAVHRLVDVLSAYGFFGVGT